MNLEKALYQLSFLSEAKFSTLRGEAGNVKEVRFSYFGTLNRHKINELMTLAEEYEMDLIVKRSGPGLNVTYRLFKNDLNNY